MISTLLLTSSVLILGVFCVRRLTFGRIAMRARYLLWIPVALRLLFPFSVGESFLSVMNVLPDGLSEMQRIQAGPEGRDVTWADSDLGVGGQNPLGQSAETGDSAAGQSAETGDSASGQPAEAGERASGQPAEAGERVCFFRSLCGSVWFLGFLAVGGHMLLSGRRFMRYLKRNRRKLWQDELPEAFAKRLFARGIKVYQVQGLPSPCLVGRDIYVGGRAVSDPHGMAHILAHEYSHALHRDGMWAFLRSFLTAVYWFDPLVWAAAYASRQDSELACDEAAVSMLGEAERFAYGRTLLSLLKNGDGGRECPGMAFLLNRGERGARERIGALAACGNRKGTAAVLTLAAALLLCGCAFTGAVRDDAAVSDTVVRDVDALKTDSADAPDAAVPDIAGRDVDALKTDSADNPDAAGQGNGVGGDADRSLREESDQVMAGRLEGMPGADSELIPDREGDDPAGEGRDDLEKPLVNEEEGHYDVAITFTNPCPDYTRISVRYGEQTDPAAGEVMTHTGVDMAADEGTDILAAADGRVFMTGFDTVNGNYVALWHVQSGQMTYYAHCKTVDVEEGQQVAQGEKIAAVGQTGMSTGPHLHFAVSSGNNWEEPDFLELK